MEICIIGILIISVFVSAGCAKKQKTNVYINNQSALEIAEAILIEHEKSIRQFEQMEEAVIKQDKEALKS